MPKFSRRSIIALSSCHPDLQVLLNYAIKTFDFTVTEGFRNEADQNKAYASGNSKVRWPNGKHNTKPSLAVDIYPYPINFDDEKLQLWFGGYILGLAQILKDEGKIKHSIRWGGSWNGLGKLNSGNMLNDLGHFEVIP
jgi:peptidoglycan L-alanyl-D-glutamate endopeptidase CwlK